MATLQRSILLSLLVAGAASCQAGQPGRTLYDLGYGGGAGVAIGAFRYADEGRGGYIAMNTTGLGEGKGTNYDGTLGPGGFPGDEKTGESESGIGMSGGFTYRANDTFGAFAGLAYNVNTIYNNYYDPTHILDPSGHYNVTAEDDGALGLEVGGHLMASPSLALGLRANTATGGVILSLAWTPTP